MFLLGFPYNAEARAGEKQTKTKTQTKKKKKKEDFLKTLLWTKLYYTCVILDFQQLQNVFKVNNMQFIYF